MKLSLDSPQVMSIINATPDSFFEESRNLDSRSLEISIQRAVEEGADILDIGGYSSRPGAAEVPEQEEIRRVLRAVTIARNIAPEIPISIDTFRSSVVKAVVGEIGKIVVNDISAGELDDQMIQTVADLRLPYIAMHMRGTPQNMQHHSEYDNVCDSVIAYLKHKAEELEAVGIQQVILDLGFGFAKTLEQNYQLLGALPQLTSLGYPVLAGLSRKSMIYNALNISPNESLTGTIALNWECLRCGCKILRVHDTKPAVQTVKLFEIYEANRQSK